LEPFPVNAGSVIFSVLMLLPFVDYDQGKAKSPKCMAIPRSESQKRIRKKKKKYGRCSHSGQICGHLAPENSPANKRLLAGFFPLYQMEVAGYLRKQDWILILEGE